jgi:CRISPR-associated protein Csm1
MDETVLKIAIAGFMHDIGKLAGAGKMGVSEQFLLDNADLYQPFFQGRHTHQHAVYTAAFIDHIEKLLPRKLNQAQWGLEDTFINLAAGHHKPLTAMQWVIAIADRVSSGWDRAKFDEEYNRAVTPKDYRKTRLLPILERLLRPNGDRPSMAGDYNYCYPLAEVSSKTVFPVLKDEVGVVDETEAMAAYKSLFDEFVFALERVLHKEDNLELWFEHFTSLMMVFSSFVPAARAGNVIPDVSLFDHLKTTSALAVALYLYHTLTGTMTLEAIKDYDQKKFLVISSDFYGIQNFIFSDSGEAKKNRSKILRGRSFAVTLFSELAADMLCRAIGIPAVSVVLNAAGKFTIIAPNTEPTRQAMIAVESRINDWLMAVSYGENSIGIGAVEASPEDLVKGKFAVVWENLVREMELKKYRKIDLDRFGGTVEDYLDSFHNNLGRPLCPFCAKRPSSPEVEGSQVVGKDQSACKICRDHIFLGTNIVKKERVAITTHDADLREADNRLLEPIFGEYQVAFVDGGMKQLARSGHLLKYWDISVREDGRVAKDVTAKFINGYVPTYSKEDLSDDQLLAGKRSAVKKEELIDQLQEGAPKTFAHIANKALHPSDNGKGYCGLEALGVLKADVDQLATLMVCGIQPEQFTISRLATLSRQLDWYFTLYLPHALKTHPQFREIYTVFAGGDDLFLLGPWNRIIDLVGFLHGTFADYTCRNPEVHFSAGISLHKPHTPLDRLAETADAALGKSKENRNCLTVFSETVEWRQFFELQEIKRVHQRWRTDGLINNAMVYRLNDFIGLAEKERRILSSGQVHLEHMECLKWHALFHYSVERNVGKQLRGEEKKAAVNEFMQSAMWLKKYGAGLRIALWDIIYNQRKGD